MSAELVRDLRTKERVDALTWRVRFVRSFGLVVALVGVVWTIVQPYRITLFDPSGQGFWWLLSEPPLYVIAVGILYHLVVAPALVRDLEAGPE